MNEIWKDISGYEGLYQVSNLGRIFSIKSKKVLGDRYSYGYKRAALFNNGVRKDFSVHRIVIETFVGVIPEGMEVNHKNGIKSDNRLENLEYVTHHENVLHSQMNGLQNDKGERSKNAKFKDSDIVHIRKECLSVPLRVLMGKYNVANKTLRNIVIGKKWKHIPYPEKDENIKKFLRSGLNSRSGENNSVSKLTNKDVKLIRRLKGIRSQKIIAKYFNVSKSTIGLIHIDRNWVAS